MGHLGFHTLESPLMRDCHKHPTPLKHWAEVSTLPPPPPNTPPPRPFTNNQEVVSPFLFHPAGSLSNPNTCRPLLYTATRPSFPPSPAASLPPFLSNPRSCIVSRWNRSTLSVRTCWQEPCSVSLGDGGRRRGRQERGRKRYRGMER